jgi:hypothetical protein
LLLQVRRALGVLVGAVVALVVPSTAGALTTLPVPTDIGPGGMWLVASSCPSAGACSAVATYANGSAYSEVALFDQVDGHWKTTKLDLARLGSVDPSGNLAPESISCATAGNCAIVGYFQDTSQAYQGFVATETAGVWSPATEVQMPSNVNTTNYGAGHTGDEDLVLASVSCVSAGNCTAFGDYDANSADNDEPFTLAETNGSWAQAVEAPLPPDASNAYAGIESAQIACSGAGACVAYGGYATRAGSEGPFVLMQSGGSWIVTSLSLSGLSDPANAHPAFNTSVGDGTLETPLACPSAGYCAAVGSYTDASGGQQGVLFSQSNSAWKAETINVSYLSLPAASSQAVAPTSISCSSAGNCVTDGIYKDRNGHTQGLWIQEDNGIWQSAMTVPVPTDANNDPQTSSLSVACSAAGNCVMPSFYVSNANATEQALQSWGGWGAGVTSVPLSPGQTAGTNPSDDGAAVTCAADGYCSLLDTFARNNTVVAMSAPNIMSAPSIQTGIDWISATWSPPADDGGFPVTGYSTLLIQPGHPLPGQGPAQVPASITNMQRYVAPDRAYQLTLAATNILGVGIAETFSTGMAQPSRSELVSLVADVDWPSGPKANLKAIRKAHGFTFVCQTLAGGKLSVTWYHRYGSGNHRATHKTKVAAGTIKMSSPGRYKLDVKLTAAGTKLFKSAKNLRLTGRATFSPIGQRPITRSRAFTLS